MVILAVVAQVVAPMERPRPGGLLEGTVVVAVTAAITTTVAVAPRLDARPSFEAVAMSRPIPRLLVARQEAVAVAAPVVTGKAVLHRPVRVGGVGRVVVAVIPQDETVPDVTAPDEAVTSVVATDVAPVAGHVRPPTGDTPRGPPVVVDTRQTRVEEAVVAGLLSIVAGLGPLGRQVAHEAPPPGLVVLVADARPPVPDVQVDPTKGVPPTTVLLGAAPPGLAPGLPEPVAAPPKADEVAAVRRVAAQVTPVRRPGLSRQVVLRTRRGRVSPFRHSLETVLGNL